MRLNLLVGMLLGSTPIVATLNSGGQQEEAPVPLSPSKRLPAWLDKPAKRNAVLILAGGLSGAIAKTATAPLERAKIMSQAGEAGDFLKLMTQVVRAEGWAGLWRGNTANVIRVIPNKGVLMMCSDAYKAGVAAAIPSLSSAAASSLAGGLAGLTSVLTTYPLELVRTRMAFRICNDAASMPYRSVLATLRSIAGEGGLPGMYVGVCSTLIGALPFEGIKFGLYDIFKQWRPSADRGVKYQFWTLLAGAGAGAIAHALTHPLDTIRRRMQVSGALGATKYTGMVHCVKTIAATEGLGSLFHGLAPTLLRALPNLGIQFLMYETFKSMLGL